MLEFVFCVLLIFNVIGVCWLGCLFVIDVFLVVCCGVLILLWFLIEELLFCLGFFFCVCLLILDKDVLWFFIEDLLFCLGCFFWICLLILDNVFVFLCKRFDGDFCVGVDVIFVNVGFKGSLDIDEVFFLFCLGEFFWKGLFWI